MDQVKLNKLKQSYRNNLEEASICRVTSEIARRRGWWFFLPGAYSWLSRKYNRIAEGQRERIEDAERGMPGVEDLTPDT